MADPYAAWIGTSVEVDDLAAQAPVTRLAATLDLATWTPGELPPLAHWLFHLPDARQDELGADGHPARGGLLPPIAHPRRMWAGGRVRFLAPVAIGAALTKRTTIAAIVDKAGMTFVTLHHAITADGALAIEEEQDLVYLPIAPPHPPRALDRPAPAREREMVVDETVLFRFSALTFNAHRIHYDLPYARKVEQHAGLVVHGPLQAMLLLDLAVRDGVRPATFAFRATAPLYAGRRFTLARAVGELWVRDAVGTVTMTATVA